MPESKSWLDMTPSAVAAELRPFIQEIGRSLFFGSARLAKKELTDPQWSIMHGLARTNFAVVRIADAAEKIATVLDSLITVQRNGEIPLLMQAWFLIGNEAVENALAKREKELRDPHYPEALADKVARIIAARPRPEPAPAQAAVTRGTGFDVPLSELRRIPEEKKRFSVEELARLVGVSVTTVYSAMKRGELRHEIWRGRKHASREDAARWIQRGAPSGKAQIASPAGQRQ